MIRTDEQVALEDLHRALRRTAAGHRDAARTLGDGNDATRLEALADRRDAEADQIADLIRQTGDLPDEPDADRETLRAAARHIKAAVSRDALLADRDRAEADLAGELARARQPLGDLAILDRIGRSSD